MTEIIKTCGVITTKDIKKLLGCIYNNDKTTAFSIINSLTLDELNTKIDYIDDTDDGSYNHGFNLIDMTILHKFCMTSVNPYTLDIIKELIKKGMDPNLEYTESINLNYLNSMQVDDSIKNILKNSSKKYTCLDAALNLLDCASIRNSYSYTNIIGDICKYLISIGVKHTRKLKCDSRDIFPVDKFPQIEFEKWDLFANNYKCRCKCTCGSKYKIEDEEKLRKEYEDRLKKEYEEKLKKEVEKRDELIKNLKKQITDYETNYTYISPSERPRRWS